MEPYKILGVPGSPYTRKLVAAMRYRRLPYQLILGSHANAPEGYPAPPVRLLPTVYFSAPDGTVEARVDTTPILEKLDSKHQDRSLRPANSLLAFIGDLIEDFADEWLTKPMFHYRWAHETDANHAGPMLVHWAMPDAPEESAQAIATNMKERQVSRLYVVGSTPETGPVIEASYRRILSALANMIEQQGYCLGSRPCAADFALFGQLTQLLSVDPTPVQIGQGGFQRVRAWMDRVEDLSGLESDDGDWAEIESLKVALGPLLKEVSELYLPYLKANAEALSKGEESFTTTLGGQQWSQPVFPYQAKCLNVLREKAARLSAADQATVKTILEDSSGSVLFD